MRAYALTALLLVLPVRSHFVRVLPAPPVAEANDNRHAAGIQAGRTLELTLVAREALWVPTRATPPLQVQAFSEGEALPSVPGPLIRVREGTTIVVTLRNTLAHAITVHGLATRPVTDTLADRIVVAPGASTTVRFLAGMPGTYMYYAFTSDSALDGRVDEDSQLGGVIVVDPINRQVPPDRILAITGVDLPQDTTSAHPFTDRFAVAFNGRMWPETEQFTYAQGTTVHVRVVNLSWEAHPMHLHGFFFRLESLGDNLRDTLYPPARQHLAVTQVMFEGSTMTMSFVVDRPGNWLLHCHLAAHTTPDIAMWATGSALRRDSAAGWIPDGDSMPMVHEREVAHMSGLIIGIHVLPHGKQPAFDSVAKHAVRLLVAPVSVPSPAVNARFGVAVEDPRQADSSVHVGGRPLVLTQGERAHITIVNGLDVPLSIHWHGVELESFFDGVPGWSGDASRQAPMIAPADSFVAWMTPPRPGTYIYHAHMDSKDILGGGVYGALIVMPKGATYDPTHDLTFVGGGGELFNGPTLVPCVINGGVDSAATPIEMHVGERYRLRFVDIMDNNRVDFGVTTSADSLTPLRWQPIAKDGADLPPALTAMQPATQKIRVGETYDFAFTPDSAGLYAVRGSCGPVRWRQTVVVR